jgi:predicted NBD/HSP70 family sugar kinase
MAKRTHNFEPGGVGVQAADVRQTNQRVLLTHISLNPGFSAAELSRISRLAPQTVASILQDLEQAGLVRMGEVIRGKRGQPPRPCFIDPEGAYAIGVEIGWRHLEATMVGIGGQSLGQYRRDYTFPDHRTIFAELTGVVGQFASRLPSHAQNRIVGVGIAAPNNIGRNVGLLNDDPAIAEAWRKIDLAAEARKALDRPVTLYNDGNAACWAEIGSQPKPRPASFTYILISTFISAGILAESKLWEGPTGNSANLGSMLVTDRHGHQQFLHLLASIYALERRLNAAGIVVPPTSPLFWPWAQWEEHVAEWIEDGSRAIAKALLNTAAVFEFDTAVLDGVLPPAILDRILAATRAHLAEMPVLTFDRPSIVKGHLGGAAPSTGAAYRVLFSKFFSREEIVDRQTSTPI